MATSPLPIVRTRPTPAAGRAPDLPSLTGLRWVTAMMIFLFHIVVVQYFADPAGTPWIGVFVGGGSGVTVFFILSGFVLAWGADARQKARSFYIRRLARVYPLHLVAVVLALITAATFVPGIRTPGIAPIGADVLLVSTWSPDWWQAGNPVSWSLGCEAFFYLLFPVLIRLLRGRSARTLALVAGAGLAVMMSAPALAAASPLPMDASSTPLMRLPEFVLGIVAALLLQQRQWQPPRPRTAVLLAIGGYVAAILPQLADAHVQLGHTAGAVTFVLLIASLAAVDARGGRTFLAGPRWQALGRVSFAFYLVHLLVMASVSSPWPGGHPHLDGPAATVLMVAAFLVALALACVLHLVVEIPGQRLICRLDRRRAERIA
jgi:peptidoglycan/LPS O-acetylase OafA/YrhL